MKTIETGRKTEDFAVSEDVLATIILEAKSFDATVPQTDPNEASNDSDDREISALETQKDNPARQVLEQSINGLNDQQKANLVALAWVGRGDYDAVEWPDAMRTAKERDGSVTSYYLSGIPLLGNYLEAGADALGISVAAAETEALSHNQNPDPVRSVR